MAETDLISRQAAIDELEHAAWGKEWDKALAKAMLESLPSAQPEERTGKRTETHACDLISRQAAIDAIHEDILLKPHNDSWFRENHEFVTVGYVERTLLAVPSAQPRKKGKWIWKDREVNRYRKETGTTEYGEVITIMVHDNYLQKINYCPVCGKRGDDTFMNYCPNCGAEMDGFEEE